MVPRAGEQDVEAGWAICLLGSIMDAGPGQPSL